MNDWDFEVAVIGGGPGGSAAASALARRGHRVLLLERDHFPRFHIGESQLPWLGEVLSAIGAEQAVATAGFVEKWGAAFSDADGDEFYADFTEAREVPTPQTYQVPREKFDQVLLQHASACGACVLQGRRADRADFGPTGVTVIHSGETGEQSVRVGAVIDCSGRFGFLARQFGERRMDPVLQSISLHRQFIGVPRREGRRSGDIRVFGRRDRGWVWFIPISATVTSVGVVIPKAVYAASTLRAERTPEDMLAGFLAETPAAARLVTDAQPVSPARFEADYSYLHDHHAGDRYLLVGDAGAFLDPIFSTGVLLAMQSGIEAAAAISEGLRRGDLRARRFARYERRLVRRYHHFRRFAVGFYDSAFSDLFFRPSRRFGLYGSMLSVLAGNWRPSLGIRLRLGLFFVLVSLQRRFPVLVRPLPGEPVTSIRS